MARIAALAMLIPLLLTGVMRPAAALDLVPLTLDQLIQQSPRIVVAKCMASETRAVKAYGGNPFTFARFAAAESLAGDLNASFELRIFGGRLGDVNVSEDGLPLFVPGTRYLLFLGPSNQDGFPLLKPQGVFEVVPPTTPGGAERLRSTLDRNGTDTSLQQVRERVRTLRSNPAHKSHASRSISESDALANSPGETATR